MIIIYKTIIYDNFINLKKNNVLFFWFRITNKMVKNNQFYKNMDIKYRFSHHFMLNSPPFFIDIYNEIMIKIHKTWDIKL